MVSCAHVPIVLLGVLILNTHNKIKSSIYFFIIMRPKERKFLDDQYQHMKICYDCKITYKLFKYLTQWIKT